MSRPNKIPTLFLLLLGLFIFDSNACLHDTLNVTVEPYPYPNPAEIRILASSEKKNIRIAAFYCIISPELFLLFFI